ncbi:MAG: formate hydrogenlyase transcriptional activator [Myxococcota bacterium]|jgi:formate hydrogenlyase transcriptional activator
MMATVDDDRTPLADRLDALERRQHQILECAGEGIYGLDTEGMTTFANAAAEAILGWDRGELANRPQHAMIHHSHRDGSPYKREDCKIYAAFTEGVVHRVDSEVFWRKDGTSVEVEYVSTPIRDESGALAGAVVTFRDITERKRKQAELETALAEVQHLKDRLQAENSYLQDEIHLSHGFDEIIGQSRSLAKTKKRVEQVAGTDATVLILGETGVGKELIARAIHQLSTRKARTLVKVNCAALPTTLIESELFGHERGAFTGATAQRIGRFELADGGTLLLDEIGELPLELQAKLLRALQEGEFERLGASRTIKVDIRIVASTNRDLVQAVKDGTFRSDLYYRLSVFPVEIAPLRERKDDIRPLVGHFVRKFSKKFRRGIDRVPEEVQRALTHYDWPGNVRELQNIIERAMILSTNGVLEIDEALSSHGPQPVTATVGDDRTLEAVERAHIVGVLESTGWRVEGDGAAAMILGMHPNTLRSRMKKNGIVKVVSGG